MANVNDDMRIKVRQEITYFMTISISENRTKTT